MEVIMLYWDNYCVKIFKLQDFFWLMLNTQGLHPLCFFRQKICMSSVETGMLLTYFRKFWINDSPNYLNFPAWQPWTWKEDISRLHYYSSSIRLIWFFFSGILSYPFLYNRDWRCTICSKVFIKGKKDESLNS